MHLKKCTGNLKKFHLLFKSCVNFRASFCNISSYFLHSCVRASQV